MYCKYFNLETSHINIVTGESKTKSLNTDHPIRIERCTVIYKVTFTKE